MEHRRVHSLFRNILVGYDGSEHSEKAALTAFEFAASLDAKVLVFAVARPPEPAAHVELEAVLDDAKEHFEAGFRILCAKAQELGIGLRTEIAVGHPAEQIIHRAEVEKADLIVLGRRGTSVFHKWMLGSISEKVLRYAHCPVMILH